MIAGVIVMASVSLLLFVFSWLIWKKEKIELVNLSSRDKVSEENRQAFCAAIGKGLLIMGIGTVLSTVLFPVLERAWAIVLPIWISYAVGITLMVRAVIRYNHES